MKREPAPTAGEAEPAGGEPERPPSEPSSRRALPPGLRVVLTAASPRVLPLVTECLRLRALARAVLFGAPATLVKARFQAARSCGAPSWRIFLQADRCALPLYSALQHDGQELPDAECRAVLAEVRQQELQRILAARAQLLESARIAAEQQVAAIVLKGGLAAIEGSLIDLSDVDVLLPAADAGRFARALERRGYDSGETEPDAPHLAPHRLAGLLHIEVHRRLDGFDPDLMAGAFARAQGVPSAPGLLRLSPPDHLWHLLLHVGIQHVDRRAALRDQLLIRDAVAECTPAELDVVYGRIRAHLRADVLRQTLEAALGDGGEDHLTRLAAARYASLVAILSGGRLAPEWLWVPLLLLTLTLALEPRDYFRHWRELARPAPAPRRRPRGRFPAGVLVLLRALRLAALTPFAALLAWKSARADHALIDTLRDKDRS